MVHKTLIVCTFMMLMVVSFEAFGDSKFNDICSDPNERERVIEHATKTTFPEYTNDSLAFENLKKKTREYVDKLCSNVGKRAFHGSWHPDPFDYGEIIGVAYFLEGQSLGYGDMTAKNNEFYYIIEEGGASFVSRCSRVNPK